MGSRGHCRPPLLECDFVSHRPVTGCRALDRQDVVHADRDPLVYMLPAESLLPAAILGSAIYCAAQELNVSKGAAFIVHHPSAVWAIQ